MGKGTRNERKAVDILQSVGYATYRPATVRYGENDMWGLFDVLAVAPHVEPRAVQVKTNGATGLGDWVDWTWLWRELGFLTEYWVRHDRAGWTVHRAGVAPDDDRRACKMVYDGRESAGKIGEGLQAYLEDKRFRTEATA